jgi:hypothetical protein
MPPPLGELSRATAIAVGSWIGSSGADELTVGGLLGQAAAIAAAAGRKSTATENRRTEGLSDARKRQIRGTRQPKPNSRAGATPRRYIATIVSTTRRSRRSRGNSASPIQPRFAAPLAHRYAPALLGATARGHLGSARTLAQHGPSGLRAVAPAASATSAAAGSPPRNRVPRRRPGRCGQDAECRRSDRRAERAPRAEAIVASD